VKLPKSEIQNLKAIIRKERRHAKALAEGRVIKSRRSNLTDEERRTANSTRQARHRGTVSVEEQSARRQARRLAEKERLNAEASAKENLWQHCQKFIKDQRISCAETVHQTDRVIVNAYEFIEGVCEIVGYEKDEDSEDDT
jgi:hypothetical protein